MADMVKKITSFSIDHVALAIASLRMSSVAGVKANEW